MRACACACARVQRVGTVDRAAGALHHDKHRVEVNRKGDEGVHRRVFHVGLGDVVCIVDAQHDDDARDHEKEDVLHVPDIGKVFRQPVLGELLEVVNLAKELAQAPYPEEDCARRAQVEMARLGEARTGLWSVRQLPQVLSGQACEATSSVWEGSLRRLLSFQPISATAR